MNVDAAWEPFLAIVAGAKAADEVFEALRDLINEHVGNRLFTASAYDVSGGRSRRLYSENTAAYPVGGLKPISAGKWYDRVIAGRQIFSSLTIEEIAEVFFDWQLIQSLGCESNLNMPVVVGREVIGTVNLLERTGFYTADRVAAARELLPFATVTLLAAAHLDTAATSGA
jgi:hypothetical protein